MDVSMDEFFENAKKCVKVNNNNKRKGIDSWKYRDKKVKEVSYKTFQRQFVLMKTQPKYLETEMKSKHSRLSCSEGV